MLKIIWNYLNGVDINGYKPAYAFILNKNLKLGFKVGK